MWYINMMDMKINIGTVLLKVTDNKMYVKYLRNYMIGKLKWKTLE